jgi:SWI/SNF related-matrix-associated actin-dependent regulator of chromatin subfamily C
MAGAPATKVDHNLDLRKSIFDVNQGKQKEPTVAVEEKTCFTCGANCTRQHYHNVRTRTHFLCPSCFADGRFLSTQMSSDYVRVFQDTEAKPHPEWTDAERLKLLEAVEMFDDDWSQIAEYVATRTREECVLEFLKLPIEEPFLGADKGEAGGASLGPFQYARMPFSQADNPVLSIVSFLASVVNPGVAAEAARAAMQRLSMSDEANDVKLEQRPVTKDVLQAAGATALAAAAVKSKQLADYEEREMQKLVNAIVETQIQKLELKLQQFEELEALLDEERKTLERERRKLIEERLEFNKMQVAFHQQMQQQQQLPQ